MSRKRRYLVAALVAVVVSTPVVLRRCQVLQISPEAQVVATLPLTGHTLPVSTLSFSTTGNTLTSAAWVPGSATPVEVVVWDLATGERVQQRQESPGGLLEVAIAPDGQRMVLAREEGGLVWWDLSPWRERPAPAPLRVKAVAYSREGKQVALFNANDEVILADETGLRARTCPMKSPGVVLLAFSPGGSFLALGDLMGQVQVWNTATGQCHTRFPGHTAFVQSLVFSPDGELLASSANGGSVKLWDVARGREKGTLRARGKDALVAFVGNGAALAVTNGSAVEVWDVKTGWLMTTLKGHVGQIRCLAVSPDGTRLATGGFDRAVRVWDLARTLEGRLP